MDASTRYKRPRRTIDRPPSNVTSTDHRQSHQIPDSPPSDGQGPLPSEMASTDRKQSRQVLDKFPKDTSIFGVFHIDLNGIHVKKPHCLEIWSHGHNGKIKQIASYRCPSSFSRSHTMNIADSQVFGAYRAGESTVYATDSGIFVVADGTLGSARGFGERLVCDFKYHQYCSTYLILDDEREISEYTDRFNFTGRVHCPFRYDIGRIVPSDCSSNIYVAWRRPNDEIILGVSHGDTLTYIQVSKSQSSPMLLLRPNCHDVLTMFSGHKILMLDMWHSSLGGEHITSRYAPTARYGVHINSNICATSNGSPKLHIFDYRCRSTCTLQMSGGACNLWYADGLYVKGHSSDVIYMFI